MFEQVSSAARFLLTIDPRHPPIDPDLALMRISSFIPVAAIVLTAACSKAPADAGANPDKPDSAAGYSARDYAARDNRGRQILQLIEAKKPKPPSAH